MTQKIKMLNTDSVQKFLLEDHNARGVIVHLTQSYHDILKQHQYPCVIKHILGEALVCAALLMETIKLDGRMTIQFQSKGAIRLLVAQINSDGHLRGLAQWDSDAPEEVLRQGFSSGELVVTLFRKGSHAPMQGIVSLENRTVSEALAYYFKQSEQLPTHFSVAVTDEYAVGMLLQQMPEQKHDYDKLAWQSLLAQIKKINPAELFYDNNASFLLHYFSEESIRLFDARELVFQCGCTVEKMENAIRLIGATEANDILKEKSEIVVTCEYCNHAYTFDRDAVEAIFRS
jgi:molecular chaperone Hsp33